MNDRLEQAALVYANLAKAIKEAERNVDRAKDALELLRSKQLAAAKELSESVGNNIPRKAFVVDGVMIVTVDQSAGIHVFENGVEVR